MVKSNNGRSVHDSVQGVESPRVDDVGLDSGGFPTEGYNPKQVTGTTEVKDQDNYQQNPGYDEQDKVREWSTQGYFGPDEHAFDVFSEVMNSPAEELENDSEMVTDGGADVYGGEAHGDVGHEETMGSFHEEYVDSSPAQDVFE